MVLERGVITISVYIELLPELARGAVLTFQILVASAIMTFILGLIAGLGRISKLWIVRTLSGFYIEVFRGTSLLVQMFWIYFALPAFGLHLSAFWAGTIALGLNYGAYASEIVRGAVESVPKGQHEAAIALNMSPGKRMVRIILPQAFRMMIPGFGNISIELLKGTSLVSLITLSDLTYQAMTIRNSNIGYSDEIFILLLFMYFLLALPIIFFTHFLEKRASRGVVKV
jgi:polar amino acid transport system permease protein